MAVEKNRRYGIAEGGAQISAEGLAAPGHGPIATLGGRPLLSNRGIPLNLDWVKQVRVNTSAVERRAQSHVLRRTVKKDWQIAWLLRAVTCMDLTTLSGDDTDERVRRLCAKGRHPISQELTKRLGIEELGIKVGAVCVYHRFVETARRALEGGWARLPCRYVYWLGGVLRGDLGESLRIQKPVTALIAEKLPVTLELAAIAIVIALVIGIPAGIVSAVFKGTAWDYAANVVALWGLSTPNFWLGIMMILLFSVSLGWLPASGYVSPFEDLRANLASMIMPAFVLGNAIAAVLMRHTRSAMLQVLSSDYVRTARAKGLDERVVVLHHALRNALVPIITLGALEFGTLLSGAVLTEQVFTIPGFGKLIVDAVFNRDYAVVQGVVLFTATAYIALNLLADLAYFAVNPRMRG